MKKSLLGLACVALIGACGRSDTEATEECEECTCDFCCSDMVPAVHDHPDAQPVGALDATGYYLTEYNIVSNSCDEEFVYDPEGWQDAGLWTVAAVQDTYLWISGDFVLTSTDGELFSLVIDIEEGMSWSCVTELYEFNADLSFTELDMTADYTKHYVGNDCLAWDEEIEDFTTVNYDCTYKFEMRGTKQ